MGRKAEVIPAGPAVKLAEFHISEELAAKIDSQVCVTPLEYMLAVVNDDLADIGRRDRMAIAAAPYVHVRADAKPMGKKETAAEDALSAGKGTEWGDDLGEVAHLN